MDTSTVPNEPKSLDLRLLTQVAYGLFALGVLTVGLFGIAILAAMVLMYVKRADAAGTVYALHFDWLSHTFWWGLLWTVVSSLATLIYVGWLGVIATTIWVLYRVIKGWIALLEYKTP